MRFLALLQLVLILDLVFRPALFPEDFHGVCRFARLVREDGA